MLNGDPANIAVTVKIKQGIFVKFFGFCYLNRAKLNI